MVNTRSAKCVSSFFIVSIAILLLAGCATPFSENSESRTVATMPISAMAPAMVPHLPGVRLADHRTGVPVKHFVRFGQGQIQISVGPGPNSQDLWDAMDPMKLSGDLQACLSTAVAEQLDVLILPELALTLPQSDREDFLDQARQIAIDEEMIIVAGSFYDSDRFSRIAVIGPGWTEFGYKVRPSRFEVSPIADKGMRPGPEILVLQTDYGNLAVITCVDLISDEVQFLIRSMVTRGEIDVLININHNPAAWEFLIEANSLVRRHPVFASITNVYMPPSGRCLENGQPNDIGYCYGHSAVFASLRTKSSELPNSSKRILRELPDPIVTRAPDGTPISRALPYSNVAADVEAFREALLVYELNMRLKRVPLSTNAPDQGYPPIRGIKIVDLIR